MLCEGFHDGFNTCFLVAHDEMITDQEVKHHYTISPVHARLTDNGAVALLLVRFYSHIQ